MATVERFLTRCASHIGKNGTEFNMWYWGYTQPAWCACFLSYVAAQEGVPGFKSAAVSGVLSQLGNRVAVRSLAGVRRGDFVCFNWDGRGGESWMDHIGVVEWTDPSSGRFGTIEGNTEDSVRHKTRSVNAGYHTVFCRPAYDEVSVPTPRQEPGARVNDHGLCYWSHSATLGDLPECFDGQWSGTKGASLGLQAFALDTTHLSIPGTLRIGFALHLAGMGWVDYGEMKFGDVFGTRGEGRAIEYIAPYIIENTTGKQVKFQAHLAGIGDTAIDTVAGLHALTPFDGLGTTGEARGIEAWRLWLE